MTIYFCFSQKVYRSGRNIKLYLGRQKIIPREKNSQIKVFFAFVAQFWHFRGVITKYIFDWQICNFFLLYRRKKRFLGPQTLPERWEVGASTSSRSSPPDMLFRLLRNFSTTSGSSAAVAGLQK
jgi:hypothetical protein